MNFRTLKLEEILELEVDKYNGLDITLEEFEILLNAGAPGFAAEVLANVCREFFRWYNLNIKYDDESSQRYRSCVIDKARLIDLIHGFVLMDFSVNGIKSGYEGYRRIQRNFRVSGAFDYALI